ncbi:hypothetical protein [Flavobacterium sp. S87F.05.LMB.W.Kidney.N]|uniref:hypothetical protein n=1 Tax=Flavobacterium sp. S87F.05.LMB.W.Kidney.N TaxID=1278758 RepID=UPI0010668C8E|nr:hypothetical protein [Flavobacterium sp. S87F.05.LMB.W.Kidney.N]TDX11325.1 hypothetical protein EDB96_2110 [Flavobacterium sp. S87F.05.LMB.W.Kidney.N]
MKEYLVGDTNSFFDAITEIQNKDLKEASIAINGSVNHCHLFRHLKDVKLNVNGDNSSYNIYLDPKELNSNPKWKFNSTLFFHSDNNDITYSSLNFIYTIEQYEFIDNPVLNSFGIVLMEFYDSEVKFKDCTFENNTDRTFEIIAKKKSNVTFEKCLFKGDFNFIIDIGTNVITK